MKIMKKRKLSKIVEKIWKIMKNQKFSKSPKIFALYLESSETVLPLRNPLGSARPTQHCPGSLPAVFSFFFHAFSRSDVELQNPAHIHGPDHSSLWISTSFGGIDMSVTNVFQAQRYFFPAVLALRKRQEAIDVEQYCLSWTGGAIGTNYELREVPCVAAARVKFSARDGSGGWGEDSA